MQIFFDHPLLGVGGLSRDYMMDYALATGYGYNTMLTNTFVHQFANYGVFFGAAFAWYSFKFFRNGFKLSLFLSVIGLIVLIVLYISETFYSFLPFIIVFFGTKKR